MEQIYKKELKIKRNCESCEINGAGWLLEIRDNRNIGLFHVCEVCKELMTFDHHDYVFIKK